MYIILYKFLLKNQEKDTYIVSMDTLRKYTKFTINQTYNLFKILVRHGIISCNVSRWDRYSDKELIIVHAEDLPETTRVENKKGKEIDEPVSEDDFFVSVDMQMMQHYIDIGLSGSEMAFYCLIRKHSNNTERKCWMSIDSMSGVLGVSNDKVSKMIRMLNRNYLMCSYYKKNGKRIVKGEVKTSYRFEHVIANSKKGMEWLRTSSDASAVIERNIKKWDKQNENKKKAKSKSEDIYDIAIVADDVKLVLVEDESNLFD